MRKTPFFVTWLPIYLDYLTVEKGLAKNSLSSYATDLKKFGDYLADQDIAIDAVDRLSIVRYFQKLRARSRDPQG